MSKIIFKSVYKKKYKNNFEIFAGASATNKKQEVSINLKYSLYISQNKILLKLDPETSSGWLDSRHSELVSESLILGILYWFVYIWWKREKGV